MTEWHEGYIFEGLYPPEAAYFCNNSGQFYIDEITDIPPEEWLPDNSNRRFMIKRYPTPTPEEQAAEALKQAKETRTQTINATTVEVSGHVYDANETAQARLSRVVQILPENESVDWVLSDNTVARITVAELKEVLRLAVRNQVSLWTLPYSTGR